MNDLGAAKGQRPARWTRVRRWVRALVLCSALATVAGCGAAIVNPAQRRVERSVSRAASSAQSADAFDAQLRFNPARCDCPAWELLVGDRWVRVEVREADGGSWSPASPRPMTRLGLRIRTTREVVASSSGWRYPVVVHEPPLAED
jgi:hypothetical protein